MKRSLVALTSALVLLALVPSFADAYGRVSVRMDFRVSADRTLKVRGTFYQVPGKKNKATAKRLVLEQRTASGKWRTRDSIRTARRRTHRSKWYSFSWRPRRGTDVIVFRVRAFKGSRTFTQTRTYRIGLNPIHPAALSTGYFNACATRSSGRVECWGSEQQGILGPGSMRRHMPLAPTPAKHLRGLHGISVGYAHGCGITRNGRGKCWGSNEEGQLGIGRKSGLRLKPVRVRGLRHAKKIYAGRVGSCAIRSHGSVACWGQNFSGEIGDGTKKDRFTATGVKRLKDAKALSMGDFHTCALRRTGRVACWGYNGSGELGDGTLETRFVPRAVAGLTDAVSLAGGSDFTCAIRETGRVVCWGYNSEGQLGNGGGFEFRRYPVPVKGLTDAVSVSAGYSHACAVRENGKTVCWGGNYYGELGNGRRGKEFVPVRVKRLPRARSVSLGGSYSCATLRSGRVACWGDNQSSETGDGNVGYLYDGDALKSVREHPVIVRSR